MNEELKKLASLNLTGGEKPLITSKGRPSKTGKVKMEMQKGDWVRVRRGPIEGAEGVVEKVEALSKWVTIIEVRQLNGNIIRLPRAHFEFAAFSEPSIDPLCG